MIYYNGWRNVLREISNIVQLLKRVLSPGLYKELFKRKKKGYYSYYIKDIKELTRNSVTTLNRKLDGHTILSLLYE